MAEHIYLLTIGLPLATVLLVFAMRYGAVVMQARAKGRSDAADRALAESIEEIKARVANIERILQAVD